MMPRYSGLIFDLDGTLIDSAPDIAAALNEHLAEQGWPVQPVKFVERFIGNGARRLVGDMFIELGLPSDDATIDAATAAYLAAYEREPTRHTRFFENVRDDLVALRAAGFRMGVCTNKPHALTLRILELLDLAPMFDAVLGADAVPSSKPDPGHLRAVAEAMALGHDDWAYVGDSAVDRATALAAGVPFFVVPWAAAGDVEPIGCGRITRLLDLVRHAPAQQEA